MGASVRDLHTDLDAADSPTPAPIDSLSEALTLLIIAVQRGVWVGEGSIALKEQAAAAAAAAAAAGAAGAMEASLAAAAVAWSSVAFLAA